MICKNDIEKKQLNWCPCHSRKKYLLPTGDKNPFFATYQTGQTFKIFYQLSCLGCGLIYLLQCQMHHFQCDDKSKTAFSLCLNNHRKDSKAKNTITVCKHFQTYNHNNEIQNLHLQKK